MRTWRAITEELGLSEDDRAAIFHRNADALLGAPQRNERTREALGDAAGDGDRSAGLPRSARAASAEHPRITGPQERVRARRAIARDPYIRQLEPRSILDAFVGSRSLDAGEAWSPLDDQFDVGISWQLPVVNSHGSSQALIRDALAWDLGLHFAYDEAELPGLGGTDVLRSRTYDLSGGLLLGTGRRDLLFSPFVGAGMALLFTNIERNGPDAPFEEHDSVLAGYVRGGRASASTAVATSASTSGGSSEEETRSTASERARTP